MRTRRDFDRLLSRRDKLVLERHFAEASLAKVSVVSNLSQRNYDGICRLLEQTQERIDAALAADAHG